MRGHKDFANLDMDRAKQRAEGLPEDGCMPELVHRASEDGGLTKILNQKAATPVAVPVDPREACLHQRPNVISLQRDTRDESDEPNVNANAWASFAERLTGASTMTITTGSDMLSTFEKDF